jgi:hypothetical protein
MSVRRIEDGTVQGRPGDSEAGRYLGSRDVCGFDPAKLSTKEIKTIT